MSIPVALKSVGDLLEQNADRHPQKAAIHFDHEALTFTYNELNEIVNRYANALKKAGVTKGSHVAVMLPNCPAFPVTWLSIAKLGAVMIPINVRYKSKDLTYVLNDSDADTFVIHADYFDVFDQVRNCMPRLGTILTIGNGGGYSDFALDKLSDLESNTFDPIDIMADDLLNIQYTSGTTGFPKGCLLTHEYWLTIGQIASSFLRNTDIFLSVSPFYYMDPQWELVSCFTVGCTMVLGKKYSASNFMKTVRKHRITATWATMAAWIYKQPESKCDKANALRFAWVGEFPKALHKPFEERFNVKTREVYGSTEMGLGMFVRLEDDKMVGSGSIGNPTDYRKAKIIDENGNPVSQGQTGTLMIAGPGLFKGYYNKPEENRKIFKDGWFDTGDFAYQDAEGYYYIVGRKKDMIRKSGDNISATEVEEVLRSHPKIQDAAVVPVHDEDRGEEIKAFLLLNKGETIDSVKPDEIIAFCSGKIADFKIPRYLEYREEFPMTPSNRPVKAKLIENQSAFAFYCFDMKQMESVK